MLDPTDYDQIADMLPVGADVLELPGWRPDQVDRWAGRFLTATNLLHLPAPKPMIVDTLDLNTVGMLAGEWASYKSFIALDWAWSVATGRKWAGRETERLPTLYLAGEGAHGIGMRYRAWNEHTGLDPDEDHFHLAPQVPRLLDAQDVNELCSHIRRLGARFVIVDTLSKAIAGYDENSAKDMSSAVESLYRIQDATDGGMVLVLHHLGKNGAVRGSSALEGGFDTVYQTKRDGEDVKLSRTKRKDGPSDDVLHMAFEQVELGTDDRERPVSSGIVVSKSRETTNALNKTEFGIVSHLIALEDETPQTAQQIHQGSGISRPTVFRVCPDLVERGWLERIEVGGAAGYRPTQKGKSLRVSE